MAKFFQKVEKGNVSLNNKYVPILLNIQRTFNNLEDTNTIKIYQKNKIFASSWNDINDNTLQELNQFSMQQLKKITYVNTIMKPIEFQNNLINSNQNNQEIQFEEIFYGFSSNGLLYQTSTNTSYTKQQDEVNCSSVAYYPDVRCLNWFSDTAQQLDLKIFPPVQYYNSSDLPYQAIFLCKRNELENNNFFVICQSIDLQQFYNFFQFKTTFSFSQSIFDADLKNIIYNSYFLDKKNYLSNESCMRNITYCVIQNLDTAQINEINKIISILKQNKISTKEIKNQIDLYETLNQSQQNIVLQIEGDEYYVIRLIDYPIEHLTQILKQFSLEDSKSALKRYQDEGQYIENTPVHQEFTQNFDIEKSQISQMNIENLFSTKETKTLFMTFQNLFKTLNFTLQNYYEQNDNGCSTLLQFNQQVEHFSKFSNIRALGVLYNNMGNIHFNNERYIEAMECYQQSIISSNYELQFYKEKQKKDNTNNINLRTKRNTAQTKNFSKLNIEQDQQENKVEQTQFYTKEYDKTFQSNVTQFHKLSKLEQSNKKMNKIQSSQTNQINNNNNIDQSVETSKYNIIGSIYKKILQTSVKSKNLSQSQKNKQEKQSDVQSSSFDRRVQNLKRQTKDSFFQHQTIIFESDFQKKQNDQREKQNCMQCDFFQINDLNQEKNKLQINQTKHKNQSFDIQQKLYSQKVISLQSDQKKNNLQQSYLDNFENIYINLERYYDLMKQISFNKNYWQAQSADKIQIQTSKNSFYNKIEVSFNQYYQNSQNSLVSSTQQFNLTQLKEQSLDDKDNTGTYLNKNNNQQKSFYIEVTPYKVIKQLNRNNSQRIMICSKTGKVSSLGFSIQNRKQHSLTQETDIRTKGDI
ncbi:tetratricopeptide repeat protein (macronuclear) [Tetrahymena thermophila SB210]|uniref:Tetratricopeptide repeat protein n=1 Tax=Tetrahymena thermophila (strain SB210) TaxID=312017 RepID=Q245S0_TETTS|nr:tetratricopeptide repeat protein [Tetrahymena thermophila SB210]EAS03563.2 tetratricopeptide repeat protein [Tetrahymena thermophila SB210]|eukprot:XP_001023808.2 tetratricopeptide repeat protein [Tetrahymena thermophila SB210]